MERTKSPRDVTAQRLRIKRAIMQSNGTRASQRFKAADIISRRYISNMGYIPVRGEQPESFNKQYSRRVYMGLAGG